MPSYDYQCPKCKAKHERFHSVVDRPHFTCITGCDATLEKIISPGASVQFTGTGFYQTDYKEK